MSATKPLVVEHPNPDVGWLNKLREEILEPDLPIVDPHHHLWDRPGSRYYLELLADLNSGHNIVATVFLQCFWSYRTEGPEEMRPVGETEFVASVAADAERRNGARRCMFDSNFPEDKAMCSYPLLWNGFKRIASGASADDPRALFHDTATRFYRIQI
jgi:predicted TIM-barrel fold metal-dependent hydrolase